MKLDRLKRKLLSFYINSRGWKTDRKIIVIESDDWGSTRMPSKKVYDELLAKGFPVDKLPYLRYDSLESNTDLEMLFEVLTSFRDKNGNHPVITANTIMTNPDFEKIRKSVFKEYHYELFTETYKKYPEHDRVFDLYKEGISKNIFYPQLHGLEHLNVNRWMKALQNQKSNARIAFDFGVFDLSISHTEITEDSFMDALSFYRKSELLIQQEKFQFAAKLFDEVFGFRSKTFIAPCNIWSSDLESAMNEVGIIALQGGIIQKEPTGRGQNHFVKKVHYCGEKGNRGLRYMVRNAAFEPSNHPGRDVIQNTLKQVETAFKNKKPAIISSHRLNFMGSISEKNRSKNLDFLKHLLEALLKKHPKIEFLSSAEMAELLNKPNH